VSRLRVPALGAVLVAFLAAPLPAQGPEADRMAQFVITPSRTVTVTVDLEGSEHGQKKAPKKLEAAKALKGIRLRTEAAEPVSSQGCPIIRKGAEIWLEVVDASAPRKKGVPGYFLPEMTRVTFADGLRRDWEGGTLCGSGVDKSDKGRKLGMFPRKGGKVFLENGQELEIDLLPSGVIPPECGGKAEPGKEPAEGAAGPEPRAITLPISACSEQPADQPAPDGGAESGASEGERR